MSGDAANIIAGWKQRLTALADHPAYVYRDTPQDLIEQEYHRLTGFVFEYVLAAGGFDGPSLSWMEMEREPKATTPTFADRVDRDLEIGEHNNRASRERGGWRVSRGDAEY